MMIFWTIMSAWPLNIRSSGKPLLSSTQISSRSIFSFGSFGSRWRFFLPLVSSTPSPLALASACLRSVSDDISPSFFLLALISGFPCSPFSRLFSSLRFWTSIFRASFSDANRSTILSSFLTTLCSTPLSSWALSWSMALISACKSWFFKVHEESMF